MAGADSPSVDEDRKLSLRMKLVTPVEEGSSERFSLQSECTLPVGPPALPHISSPPHCHRSEPASSEEDAAVVKVTTVSMAAPR